MKYPYNPQWLKELHEPKLNWWCTIWSLLVSVLVVAVLWLLVATAHAKTEHYLEKVKCLAETVYREARGEPFKGKLAVAQTVINRSRSGAYPNNICKVVFQRYQFSWTTGWNQVWLADQDSYQIARLALMGTHSLKDFKALYFHNTSVNPGWNRKKLAQIGNHIFYL